MRRDLNMNINAIRQRTRDLFLIFRYQGLCTCAWLLCIPLESARAGMYTIEHFLVSDRKEEVEIK